MRSEIQSLNELCVVDRNITYGVVKPGPEDDNGVRFIRGGDIANGRIDETNLRTISPKVSQQYRRTVLEGGELLVSLVGNPGEVAIAPETLAGANIARQVGLVPLAPSVNSKFIMYFLRSGYGKSQLFTRTRGAVQQVINLADLKTVGIPKLERRQQDEIVDVLSGYDDLIENNKRRIQLLEESARLLYREWFIHLRFPGHEHVKITHGVPEGWSRRRLVDVTSKIGSGATPKGGASAYQSEGIALIRSQNVYDYRFDSSGLAFINDEQADRLSNVEVNGSDVLLNITGASVGRCCLAPDYHLPARVNQHVMIIRSDSEKFGPHYLLHFINSYREKQRILAAAGAGGSTREALTKSFVQNLEVTLPSRTLMEQFEDFAKDCFEQKQKLEMQNIRLAKARDLLLPKLMSGELAA